MKLLIGDTNILIDMECASLTQVMFRLPETFITPDILYHQELAFSHPDLPTYGLQLRILNADSVCNVALLRQQYPGAGTNDLYALSLARQERCPLLAGKGKLQKAAKAERVKVHGTVWLMDRILEEGIISPGGMKSAYERMRAHNRHLPLEQIERRLRKYP